MKNIEYLPNEKKYMVNLLWIPDKKVQISDNYSLAYKRLTQNLKKLRKDEEVFWQYNEKIMEYVHLGFARQVNDYEVRKGKHYLAHQAVFRNSETSSVRIVFDGSASCYGQYSLNDCLHVGGNLQPDIFKLLLKFRLGKYGVSCDITKAYLMVKLKPEDHAYCRYLWIDPAEVNSENPKIAEFEMMVTLFGLKCSGFMLGSVIQKHLNDYKEKYPTTVEIMNGSFYIDDLVVSLNSRISVETFIKESRELMAQAGMNLCKFRTNLEIQDRENFFTNSEKTENLWSKGSEVFGVTWDEKSDNFLFKVDSLLSKVKLGNNCTKRKLVSLISTIWDPLGYLACFTIRAKIGLQEIWKLKFKWDQELPSSELRKWKSFFGEIQFINEIKIPRWVNEGLVGNIKEKELHIFCDASMHAMATVAYLRVVANNAVVRLLSAKTKVCPLSSIHESSTNDSTEKPPDFTIPRKELVSCLLGARMAKVIIETLAMDDLTVFYWSDSMIALSWIRGTNRKWKQFVTNRVDQIKKLSNPRNWRFVKGTENVADMATRGVEMKKLIKSEEWWNGPIWLRQTHDMDWPLEPMMTIEDIFKDVLHETFKNKKKSTLVTRCTTGPTNLVNMGKFSDLLKLLKAVAYCFRFYENVKSKIRNRDKLSCLEIERAETICIKLVQAECFSKEIKEILKLKVSNENAHIEFKSLRVIFENGILFAKNRSMYSPHMKSKLILLPSEHHFTKLLVERCHRRLHHGGVRDVMSHLRETYWVIRMRQTVKRIINPCIICKRWSAKHYNEEVAPLPPERITPSRPFAVCGLDFAGPLHIYDNQVETKSYILLFSCATTRAIHLELVGSMSTFHFLLAFKRFIGRRGLPRICISDNYSTFKRVNSDLQQGWKHLKSTEFNDYLIDKKIEWKFIVQYAPFWGGFYERMVRSVKTPLKKILNNSKVETEEMRTILIEIEMILNNRPLTYMHNSPDEVSPLTPSHFLVGRRLDCLPPIYEHLEGKNDFVDRYNALENVKDKFWDLWTREYLPELNHFYQSRISNVPEIKIGDIVLVGSETKRSKWKLGKIESLRDGKDGKARAAVVKTDGKKLLTRPIQKLYPLEICSNESTEPIRVIRSDDKTDEVFEARATGSNVPVEDDSKRTRSGRQVKWPRNLSKDDYVFDV